MENLRLKEERKEKKELLKRGGDACLACCSRRLSPQPTALGWRWCTPQTLLIESLKVKPFFVGTIRISFCWQDKGSSPFPIGGCDRI